MSISSATIRRDWPSESLIIFVPPALRHDLEVPPVIIDVDVAPLGDRVHQLLVEGPIDAAEDDAAVGDLGQPAELVERRDARDGARHLERGGSRRVGSSRCSWDVLLPRFGRRASGGSRPCARRSQAGSIAPVPSRTQRRQFLGPDRQESAGLDGLIRPLGSQPLDDDPIVVEPPDLGDAQRRIDPRAVDLGPGDVDLDRQVGVGIVGDVVGAAFRRRGVLRQLLGQEVIGIDRTPGRGRSQAASRSSRSSSERDIPFVRDDVDQLIQASLIVSCSGPFAMTSRSLPS